MAQYINPNGFGANTTEGDGPVGSLPATDQPLDSHPLEHPVDMTVPLSDVDPAAWCATGFTG